MIARKLRLKLIRMLADKPTTMIASSGLEQDFYSERKRSMALLKKYGVMYDQGGLMTEALNTYPTFVSTNGYRLEGQDTQVAEIEDILKTLNFESILWESIVDTIVYGDAFQEIIRGRDGVISRVIPRPGYSFEILHDSFSDVKGYNQYVNVNGVEKKIPLKPDKIFHMQFWKMKSSEYGHSLIHRAYDEILNDTKIYEATTTAIYRHGYKKYHIRVGQEGEIIPQDVLEDIDADFQELDSKNDFVTSRDLEIDNIDKGGLDDVSTYNNIGVMRLAAALGVPEELLGLNRSSTNATAAKRIEAFFKKIGTLQKEVARTYNTQIINRVVPPGSVELVFNDVCPEDEGVQAKWMSMIMNASGDDRFAVLPKEWIQEQFGIA